MHMATFIVKSLALDKVSWRGSAVLIQDLNAMIPYEVRDSLILRPSEFKTLLNVVSCTKITFMKNCSPSLRVIQVSSSPLGMCRKVPSS